VVPPKIVVAEPSCTQPADELNPPTRLTPLCRTTLSAYVPPSIKTSGIPNSVASSIPCAIVATGASGDPSPELLPNVLDTYTAFSGG
jgi:hypothetical protein